MNENDSVDIYWREIKDSQPLSREREIELAVRIKEGDESALEELVSANLRFVVSVAGKYQNRGLPMSELIAEGNCGLMEAARRFDEERGYKFITYAVWWIRQAIQSALRKNRNVHRPTNRISDASKVSRVYDELLVILGKEPTDEEVAEKLDMSVNSVREAYLSTRPEVSLDTLFGDEKDRSLHDLFSSENEGIINHLEYHDLEGDIDKMLMVLDKREIYIIRRYFGLRGEEPMTLEEIGNEMGVTRERVRQLKNRAFSKIRESYQAEIVEDEITY